MTVLLEVCVDTAEALADAVANGAGRIELCAALGAGGLTPSIGFMHHARGAGVPVHALIRPRAGGFVYTAAEMAVMQADIAAAREAGLAGVVIGASRPDHTLDWPAIRTLVGAAQGMAVTLHRAFDLAPDLGQALEGAVAAGIGRVLTSGGAVSAPAGAEAIAAMIRKAAGRIVVMPGGGITPGNADALVRKTGAIELHASCRAACIEEARLAKLGFGSGPRLDPGIVRALVDAIAPAPAVQSR